VKKAICRIWPRTSAPDHFAAQRRTFYQNQRPPRKGVNHGKAKQKARSISKTEIAENTSSDLPQNFSVFEPRWGLSPPTGPRQPARPGGRSPSFTPPNNRGSGLQAAQTVSRRPTTGAAASRPRKRVSHYQSCGGWMRRRGGYGIICASLRKGR